MVNRKTWAACLISTALVGPWVPAAHAQTDTGTMTVQFTERIRTSTATAQSYSPGVSGAHIAELQRTLIGRGFAIPAGPTGFYGAQTLAAVAAFQRSQGWTGGGADGIPGPLTLSRLGVGAATPAAPPAPTVAPAPPPAATGGGYGLGVSGPHIAELQRALIARGMSIPAGPTGFFGAQTQAAVAAFQRSQGWSGSGADGIPGPMTLARLGSAPAAAAPAPAPAPAATSAPAAFLAQHGNAIRTAANQAGIPPLVAMAQAGLESGWGSRASGNNFFGVKARATDPPESRQLRLTNEILSTPTATGFPEIVSITPTADGRYNYQVRDWFRAYPTPYDSFAGYAALLNNPRYRGAQAFASDPYRFAAAIAAAGYATDPAYTPKLHAVMRLIESLGYR